jgi:hypothetical protein
MALLKIGWRWNSQYEACSWQFGTHTIICSRISGYFHETEYRHLNKRSMYKALINYTQISNICRMSLVCKALQNDQHYITNLQVMQVCAAHTTLWDTDIFLNIINRPSLQCARTSDAEEGLWLHVHQKISNCPIKVWIILHNAKKSTKKKLVRNIRTEIWTNSFSYTTSELV